MFYLKVMIMDELELINENKKWTWKMRALVVVITTVLFVALKLIFWKVVEANAFEEIAKVVLMGLSVGVLLCAIFWVPMTMLSDARLKYFPTYGKNWFKQLLKDKFKKK